MKEAVQVRPSAIINWPHWAMVVCCIEHLTLFLWELPTEEVQMRNAVFSNCRLHIKNSTMFPLSTDRPEAWKFKPTRAWCVCPSPSSFLLLFSCCDRSSLAQLGLSKLPPHGERKSRSKASCLNKSRYFFGGPFRHYMEIQEQAQFRQCI